MKISPTIFRAYDIRGLYPREVNSAVVRTIAAAIGSALGGGAIVVARDVRVGSPELAAAVRAGLRSLPRVTVIDAGVATTPMFYFLVAHLRVAGGIMITASHNPRHYNGMKVVGKNAAAFGGDEIRAMVSNHP